MPSLFWRFTGDTVGDTVNTPNSGKKQCFDLHGIKCLIAQKFRNKKKTRISRGFIPFEMRVFLVIQRGFEPRTPCLKGRCSAD